MNLARVVAVHPERNKVDLVMLADNRRVPGVRVMSGEASTTSGRVGMPTPSAQALPDPYDAPGKSKVDVIACVGYYDGQPVVQGFLFPEVAECLFADQERFLHRTPSDFYHTVDGKGNAEWFHPSGAFIRIATDPAHEDLTAKDFDKKFSPKRNADAKVHIHIEQAGGVAAVDIAPDGKMVVTTKATALLNADGGATIKAPTILFDAPKSHFTGEVLIDKLLTWIGGMSGSGGEGATAQIKGKVSVTDDVVAGGISLTTHSHSKVKGGTDESGPPVK